MDGGDELFALSAEHVEQTLSGAVIAYRHNDCFVRHGGEAGYRAEYRQPMRAACLLSVVDKPEGFDTRTGAACGLEDVGYDSAVAASAHNNNLHR